MHEAGGVLVWNSSTVDFRNGRKSAVFQRFSGWVQNEPSENKGGFKSQGIIKLYQRHCDYAEKVHHRFSYEKAESQ